MAAEVVLLTEAVVADSIEQRGLTLPDAASWRFRCQTEPQSCRPHSPAARVARWRSSSIRASRMLAAEYRLSKAQGSWRSRPTTGGELKSIRGAYVITMPSSALSARKRGRAREDNPESGGGAPECHIGLRAYLPIDVPLRALRGLLIIAS